MKTIKNSINNLSYIPYFRCANVEKAVKDQELKKWTSDLNSLWKLLGRKVKFCYISYIIFTIRFAVRFILLYYINNQKRFENAYFLDFPIQIQSECDPCFSLFRKCQSHRCLYRWLSLTNVYMFYIFSDKIFS